MLKKEESFFCCWKVHFYLPATMSFFASLVIPFAYILLPVGLTCRVASHSSHISYMHPSNIMHQTVTICNQLMACAAWSYSDHSLLHTLVMLHISAAMILSCASIFQLSAPEGVWMVESVCYQRLVTAPQGGVDKTVKQVHIYNKIYLQWCLR